MADEENLEDGDLDHPRKVSKVEQNHDVTITHINSTTMDHYCTVQIYSDHLNPDGIIKRGVRINLEEFSKGSKILSERCGYRLLTPLSAYRYAAYLNKRTEEYMKEGNGGIPSRPVVQVHNQSPFRFGTGFYLATNTEDFGIQVFEIFRVKPQKKQPDVSEASTEIGKTVEASVTIPINSQASPGSTQASPGSTQASPGSTQASPGNPEARPPTQEIEAKQSKAGTSFNPLVGNSSGTSQNSFNPREDIPSDMGENDDTVFARSVPLEELPFVLNWTGPPFKSMIVDDVACQKALISIIAGLDKVHEVEGLGVCVLSEFGRFLLYNILVDSDEGIEEEMDEEDGEKDKEEFRGFKQMLLFLQSAQQETGKSTLIEILARIFYRRKQGICSTVSFDSARKEFAKAQPVLIDDYNNDDIGKVLVSRSSKAIWGKATIIMKKETTVPKANLLICTNELIPDLKVEGKNKQETYRKFSVVDLGERPMRSDIEGKAEVFTDFVAKSNIVSKHFPSFVGLMLRNCGQYIKKEDFKQFKDITSHERLANILNNAVKLHKTLGDFCEKEKIEKPPSLKKKLNYSCLTNKSELVIKMKVPEQVVEFLMEREEKIIKAVNPNDDQGIAFAKSSVRNYPWSKQSFNMEHNGEKVYLPLRTRRLSEKKSGNAVGAYFLKLDFINEPLRTQLEEYMGDDGGNSEEEEEEEMDQDKDEEECVTKLKTPEETIVDFFKKQVDIQIKTRKHEFMLAKKYILSLSPKQLSVNCSLCGKKCKSQRGITQHLKKCSKAMDAKKKAIR